MRPLDTSNRERRLELAAGAPAKLPRGAALGEQFERKGSRTINLDGPPMGWVAKLNLNTPRSSGRRSIALHALASFVANHARSFARLLSQCAPPSTSFLSGARGAGQLTRWAVGKSLHLKAGDKNHRRAGERDQEMRGRGCACASTPNSIHKASNKWRRLRTSAQIQRPPGSDNSADSRPSCGLRLGPASPSPPPPADVRRCTRTQRLIMFARVRAPGGEQTVAPANRQAANLAWGWRLDGPTAQLARVQARARQWAPIVSQIASEIERRPGGGRFNYARRLMMN